MKGMLVLNGQAVALKSVPLLNTDDFSQYLLSQAQAGARVASFFAIPAHTGFILLAVLAHEQHGYLELMSAHIEQSYQAFTPELMQVHWFEREIAEQWGITPLGHPWLKSIRFQNSKPGITDYFQVQGDEIHEVAVGPVHAGIIEPGHFRFQCQGETVLHLEIELGYQHRGIEHAMVHGNPLRRMHYLETAAGDTTIGHATAYAMNLEALSGTVPSVRSQLLRAIALELERIANHTGDLGALGGDVGFLPTASYCGRLRGDILNLTATLCGNRFGRNLIRPGGLRCDVPDAALERISNQLPALISSIGDAVSLLWDSPSVMSRMQGVGTVSKQAAIDLGLVGLAARASDLKRDLRCDFPWGAYMFLESPAVSMSSGDVYARASLRWFEIVHSAEFIRQALTALAPDSVQQQLPPLGSDLIAVSLVEGFRGELCQVAITDNNGQLAHYKITDPSFHNWFALALALRDQQISDFPLCNKSFNLSYCGHDL